MPKLLGRVLISAKQFLDTPLPLRSDSLLSCPAFRGHRYVRRDLRPRIVGNHDIFGPWELRHLRIEVTHERHGDTQD